MIGVGTAISKLTEKWLDHRTRLTEQRAFEEGRAQGRA